MASPVLAASPPGIGDLCYLSPEWVHAARDVLEEIVAAHAAALATVDEFTVCEVGHNPPRLSSNYGESYKSESKPYISSRTGPGRVVYGTTLAFWLRIRGAGFEIGEGELPAEICDLKIQGDHSIMSRLARLVRSGTDPDVFKAAEAQLMPQSKWKVEGRNRKMVEHPAVRAVSRELHDRIAARVMPRCVWMSRDWVAVAREIITTRSKHPKLGGAAKHSPSLQNCEYIFQETFTSPPKYVSPDGSSCGFWVEFKHGSVTVGHGALPAEFGEPDLLTKGQYIPVLPNGRTVNAALNEEEERFFANHRQKWTTDEFNGKPIMEAAQKINKNKGSSAMPAVMGVCMLPLHDELSLRSSGEVASDFDSGVQDGGALAFDRHPDYVGTWLRYDKVDVYGRPLQKSKL